MSDPPITDRTTARTRVLVVGDDPATIELLTAALGFAGFEARAARSCAQARQEAARVSPDLAVLDVWLPDGSGFELCDALRQAHGDLGIVFLTARGSLADKLDGLARGDAYITKPFHVAEVLARINVVLRRMEAVRQGDTGPGPLRVGDLELDDRVHVVRRAGDPIELSPTEFKLLAHLLRQAGSVVSKKELLQQIWGYRTVGDTAVVEKAISQVRRKVERAGRPRLLHTVRGFGYAVREP